MEIVYNYSKNKLALLANYFSLRTFLIVMKGHLLYFFVVLSVLWLNPIRSQVAEELNERSKELLAKKKYSKAWPILKDAARLGNPEAQYNLGHAYETGIFIRKNLSTSTEWYAKSAAKGYGDAISKMMLAYRHGIGIEPDPGKAFAYAEQCASDGNIDCMHHLIGCYQEGWGTDKDPAKMVDWAIQLAKQENPVDYKQSGHITEARLNLAYWYRDGEYVEENYFKSYTWFLLYNESKKDLSYFKQRSIIREIRSVENTLDKGEILQARVEAEAILGRPLNKADRLFDAEY